MRKFKEQDPFSWDNISINKYYDILDILESEDDDITKNVRLVSVILDKDESEIWDMDIQDVSEYTHKLGFLNKFDLPSAPKKVIIGDYKLEVVKDISKISIGQYVDYQNFVTRPLRESIDKILSVFLIPEGKKYNTDYDIINLQQTIREHMSFKIAQSFLQFFFIKYLKLLMHSLRSFQKAMKKETDPEKRKEAEKKVEEIEKKVEALTHLIG